MLIWIAALHLFMKLRTEVSFKEEKQSAVLNKNVKITTYNCDLICSI